MMNNTAQPQGMVYLVGAGPGDPGLITVRGLELIRRADCLVYDYLANEAFLAEAPPDAERLYVGKKGGDHTLEQGQINQLIMDKAREGKTVVRLKGGDPYIFGRGGEEAEELQAADIPFEVVPGVSSAVAVPAYAGIPLTHRRFASLVSFITGHEDPTKPESAIPWDVLAGSPGTLVFLMGVKNLADIAAQLMIRGKDPETPAAVIHRGTTPAQRTVTGTLATIAAQVNTAGLTPPAIFVVGGVVSLRPVLNWFETRPLWGRRIVVTRSRQQASVFVQLLSELGAGCVEVPTIELRAPDDNYFSLDAALAELHTYQWLVFTSPNGVNAFFARLCAAGKDVRALAGVKIAVIGAATAQVLWDYKIKADLVPAEFRAEGLVAALAPLLRPGERVLLARAQVAREILPQELASQGATVKVVPTYKTVVPAGLPPAAEELLHTGAVDVLTFTSSSTVSNFASLVGEEFFRSLGQKTLVASIGPITSQTLARYGLTPQIQPSSYTIPALTAAIADYYALQGGVQST